MSALKDAMISVLRDEFPQLSAADAQVAAERILQLIYVVPVPLENSPGMETAALAWSTILGSPEIRQRMIDDLRSNYGVNANRAGTITTRLVTALQTIDQEVLDYGSTAPTHTRAWHFMINMALQ